MFQTFHKNNDKIKKNTFEKYEMKFLFDVDANINEFS